MQSTSGRKRWAAALRSPLRQKLLFLEAALWLSLGRLALLSFPFRTIGRYLGKFHPPALTPSQGTPATLAVARETAWAIDRAAAALPFPSVCLPRAVAAAQMLLLRKVPYRVHFGAQKGSADAKMQLHAWVDVAGADVAGTRTAAEFTEVGYFARRARTPGRSSAR